MEAIPGPEANPWWWNPARPAVRFAPEWFMVQLRRLDPDLRVVWNAYTERWQVWAPSPRIQHPLCAGWMMLFPVKYPDGSYCPLDERTLAKIHEVSARAWGGAKQYWDRIESETARDRAKMKADRADSVKYGAGEYYNYMQIKNIGSGSKFADHLSGE